MKSRASKGFGILTATMLAACGAGETGGNSPYPPAEPSNQTAQTSPAQPTDGHLDLALSADGQGQCTFQWQGMPIDMPALSAAASTAMRQDVARQGGPGNVVSLPQVWIRGAATVPYNCLGGALREMQRGGAFLVRLVLPDRSGDGALAFVVLELPQEAGAAAAPAIEPQKNRIALAADGRILWNGQPIDMLRLRQYLDIVANMQPTPETHFEPAPRSRLQDVETVLAILRRANVESVMLAGTDLRTRQEFRVHARFSEAGELAP